MILLVTCYLKYRFHNSRLTVLSLLQKLNKIKKGSFFKYDNKVLQPLISYEEILELSFKIKHKNISPQNKKEIAFKQIGDVRSVYHGHGMDYEESRRYQAGDDPRYMNWQLSARTGQHYMKVFREEKQPGVFILVDRRNSMRFGTQQRLKVTQAVRTAAVAAFSAQDNNYSIGGVILDNEVEWFKENKSKQAAFNFINQAARPAKPIFDKNIDEKNINNVLLMLNEVLTTGSTLYLISDFHDLNENSQSTLLQLSAKHQINAIQITDIAEIKLPDAGIITIKSSIYAKQRQLNSSSLEQQERYQSTADEYFTSKRALFEDIAISFQVILTTENDINLNITL